ncbi:MULTISPECIES: homogentisate 1,2-dioxygenase [Fischerella]|uniref:Homogentisate 1,2-dioxygenase n=1 Tax=Fischerella muscicola CCMEE 5323 TaxID=2019572 RepID=A0A2N6K323_FISMU|nr:MULTISPECIES: homogentisate 1,2-dioxygenase [Fischerella]MBD2432026.1 homogentisate 1,2-dioxygenase [Fischerella sp. FACHB-380]PLZ89751.1 homogentisate 1,2-dioxygenase [Fischerella muscicola CCMEE 5323]
MTYYYKLGNIPHKRHTQFHQPNGSLYHEELIGMRGFSGIQSLLYHLRPPTQIYKILDQTTVDIPYEESSPLRHRHLRTATVKAGRDAIQGRIPLLTNADVCISVARPTESMSYWYRFAHGDEVIFIHDGTGVLESQYGILRYRAGDYLIIPTGVLWRIIPDTNTEQRMLVIEANGHVEPPTRYLNRYGQFLEHAPYNERDIRPPEELVTHDEAGEFEVRVKARDRITSYLYHYHPLDVVGWDGHLYPFAFNIEDFEPITGRIHQPPPVHQTFEAPGFVLCSFVPRLFDYHPQAIPAPYNHSNVDSDEVIYYVAGNFMSRKGIEVASITIHPSGIPHGPHPGMYEGSIGKERTEELAVMIDTFRPLQFTKYALQLEDKDYAYSWIA